MTNPVDAIMTANIVKGSGAEQNQNCSVELLGKIIYGDYRHGYELPCLDPVAQAATVAVNDRLSVEGRDSLRWRLLLCRLGTLHNTGDDRVAQRLALWCARSVEHLNADPRVKACNDTLERWLAGEASDSELRAARAAAWAAARAAAWAAWAAWAARAARAAGAAAEAAWAARAARATATATATAAAWAAAAAAWAESDDALMDWLDDLFTAAAKIACDEGHAIPEDQEAEYVAFTEAMAAAMSEAS